MNPQQKDTMFEQRLRPKKPWYKKWWLYAYGTLFIASIVILAALGDTTQLVLNTFSLGVDPEEISITERDDGYTSIPGRELSGEVDFNYARNVLEGIKAPSLGPDDAPVVIVEFSDFRCPFCRESYPTLRRLQSIYSEEIRFVYADYPISAVHPLAFNAAHAARCADEQDAFWQYHDSLFLNQEDYSDASFFTTLASTLRLDTAQFASCMESQRYYEEILDSTRIANELGVVGTPTFFVNGHRLPGDLPFETWQQIVSVALVGTNQ